MVAHAAYEEATRVSGAITNSAYIVLRSSSYVYTWYHSVGVEAWRWKDVRRHEMRACPREGVPSVKGWEIYGGAGPDRSGDTSEKRVLVLVLQNDNNTNNNNDDKKEKKKKIINIIIFSNYRCSTAG